MTITVSHKPIFIIKCLKEEDLMFPSPFLSRTLKASLIISWSFSQFI